MRVNWLRLTTVVMCTVLLVAAVVACRATKQFSDGDRLAPNVSIQGIKVGHLTRKQAAEAVDAQWAALLPREVRLQWDGGETTVSTEELGRRVLIDQAVERAYRVGREGSMVRQMLTQVRALQAGAEVPVKLELDQAKLKACLQQIGEKVYRAPKNADIDVDGDEVAVIPGTPGTELDLAATMKKLSAALADPKLAEAQLVLKAKQPPITEEDLQHLEVVLAEYSTRFRASQVDRTHNLRLAIKSLGRTVVMPGEVLSFNERTGPRLAERGFREAPIFVNGEVEPSTGGGVCQVATTVYNAALLANLDVIERHHHSRPVTYAPSGRDATVYWGQADLRIRNSLRHPVLLIGSVGDGSMTVKFLGSREDRYDVELKRSGVSSIGHGTEEVRDDSVAPGDREVEKPGRDGARVTLTRIVKRGGRVTKTERLHTDTYAPQTRVVKVGPPKPAVSNEELPGNEEDVLDALIAGGGGDASATAPGSGSGGPPRGGKASGQANGPRPGQTGESARGADSAAGPGPSQGSDDAEED